MTTATAQSQPLGAVDNAPPPTHLKQIQYRVLQDAERLKRFLRNIVYTFFALSIVMVQVTNPINRATAVALVLVGVVTLWLAHREHLVVASHLVPAALTIALTIFAFNGAGIVDPGIFGFTITLMMGGLLLGQRGVLIYGGLGILCVWALYWFAVAGVMDTTHLTNDSTQFSSVTYITAYLIGAIVILRIIIDTLLSSLAHAQHSAIALENLNQQLEARVTARTHELDEARHLAETLSNIGRTTNAATTYTEILEAIVKEIGTVDYMIALNIFEGHQREGASYIETVATLSPNAQKAQVNGIRSPIRLHQPTATGMVVIEDIDPVLSDLPEIIEQFKSRNLRAVMSYDFKMGDRTIGTLTFVGDHIERFTDFERNLIRGVGDLAAAATERSYLYAKQVRIAEELRALDNMKSQFLASMSHELRTPLNAILNFTEFLHMGMLGPVTDKQKDALGKALSSGRHLLSLINDILDITKIEAGMMRLFIEEDVDLNSELETVISSANGQLHNKQIRFETQIEANLPMIVCDKRRIRQVMLNLLSNAIKFTETGHVIFRAKRHNAETVRFEVEDTGPGISDDELNIVFEPFQQTETGLRHAGGTGLGLPITKRLVEAHGGELWVESETGKGTTFYVELPIHSEELIQMIDNVKVNAHAK